MIETCIEVRETRHRVFIIGVSVFHILILLWLIVLYDSYSDQHLSTLVMRLNWATITPQPHLPTHRLVGSCTLLLTKRMQITEFSDSFIPE